MMIKIDQPPRAVICHLGKLESFLCQDQQFTEHHAYISVVKELANRLKPDSSGAGGVSSGTEAWCLHNNAHKMSKPVKVDLSTVAALGTARTAPGDFDVEHSPLGRPYLEDRIPADGSVVNNLW